MEGGRERKRVKKVKEEGRRYKIQEYGSENLPAGDISGDEVIVVEGRADVVNLLKKRVSNVIGMNGAKLPKEIALLGKEKELILFTDGDRGGKLIAKNVIHNANIAYVATAPDGKEVEELTGKEILQSLRKKIAVKEFTKKFGGLVGDNIETEEPEEFEGDAKKEIKKMYKEIEGTNESVLLNASLNKIKKAGVTGLAGIINRSRQKVYAVIVDGSANATLIKACGEKGVSYLAAKNFAYVQNTKVDLISV